MTEHEIHIEMLHNGPVYWSCSCVKGRYGVYPVLGLVVLDQLAIQRATHEHILHKIDIAAGLTPIVPELPSAVAQSGVVCNHGPS